MDSHAVETLVRDLLVVLVAGLVAGVVCHRLRISALLGYLFVGAVIGEGGLQFVSQANHELEALAELGILLLLFAIGLEFSLGELARLGRFFLVGGSVQMLLVATGAMLASLAFLPWRTALLVGTATALSSTVLVFRALAEVGVSNSPHGRRAIAILLFQDAALVPLMLVVPLLSDVEGRVEAGFVAILGLKTVLFVGLVLVARWWVRRHGVGLLASMRSRELVVVFSVALLTGSAYGAWSAGLPPALGAFAAGLILSGNRMSEQFDALVLPYRETFAVVFFVTLGALMRPALLWERPLLVLAVLVGVVALKWSASTIAARLTGLSWRASCATGFVLAQVGEFGFVLFLQAHELGGISLETYRLVLVVGLGTLFLTPLFVRVARGLVDRGGVAVEEEHTTRAEHDEPTPTAVVVGAGPIGRQVASFLETRGHDVCVVDLSPVNLHELEIAGIRTVAGDARDAAVLGLAGATGCQLAVVAVPDDDVAREVVRALRRERSDVDVVVRCRFRSNADDLRRAGACAVVSEETEAARGLVALLTPLLAGSAAHSD